MLRISFRISCSKFQKAVNKLTLQKSGKPSSIATDNKILAALHELIIVFVSLLDLFS